MYTCGFRINANLVKEGSFYINAKLVKEELNVYNSCACYLVSGPVLFLVSPYNCFFHLFLTLICFIAIWYEGAVFLDHITIFLYFYS